MSIKTYKDLNVFREAYELALDLSKVTRAFPGHEQYELARQLRRAARSIPVNIVEGWAKRASPVEFKRFADFHRLLRGMQALAGHEPGRRISQPGKMR